MKRIFSKIILILTSISTLLGTMRRKSDETTDAINMQKKDDQVILEEYEMAAYHNHA